MAVVKNRAGFSLMELIVAVTIMTALAAVAVPVAGTVIDQGYARASKTEMQNLSEASSAMFLDTGILPAKIVELLSNPGLAGWVGPYLPGAFGDKISGLRGYEADAWSVAYRIELEGDVQVITSAGPDSTMDTDDDLVLQLDVTPIRRSVTRERLATINSAIGVYNSSYLKSAPLSTDYGAAHAALVAGGYLPNSSMYELDAWGDAFVGDPVGSAPTVRVTSIHLSQATTGTSGSSLGWSDEKPKGGKKSKSKGSSKH